MGLENLLNLTSRANYLSHECYTVSVTLVAAV